ncbi:SRP54-type protein [Tribonema minus]|uniref:Signal recognition particle 54 kDa protein n=1 Tax=Tribonema minus TaxID=303371 RepID=A0A835YYR6_9STRA|nr:SRP54-type protein [Tribonema minus]
MVLQELGGKLSAALRKLQSTTVVDEEVVKAIITEITRALLESDVNIKVVMELKKNVEAKINRSEDASGASKKRLIQQAVMEELVAMLDPKTPPYQMKKGASNVIMFVGLQGSGKTTTIAKFAHYYQRKGWRVAMVCADTFRAGAFDQLKQNATKLRVPFYGSYTEADPVRIAEEGVEQFRKDRFEVIIVDTSGRHKQEDALFEEMREIQAAVQPDNCVFVMDATQGQAVADQARAFHEAVPVGSVVITKLDGHAKGGGAMSAVAATKSPITFLGSGEHFDDLEPFVASSFVSKMLGFGDFGSLLRELQDTNDPGMDPKKMMDRMTKGQFTLRDFYQQIQGVLKLGPLNKMMGGMMPGIPDTAQQKRFLYMMDSMRDDELDGKVDIAGNEKRVTRIARGSGTRVEEVQLLLRQHKAREKVVAQMGKSGMMNAATDPAMAAKMAQLMQNPNSRASQAAMSKMMSPQMLKQMGGRDGVAKRMREMGGMPGMAGGGGMDMASMMQAMGGGGAGAGGAGGGMDMASIMKMAQQMGMGGPPGGGRR